MKRLCRMAFGILGIWMTLASASAQVPQHINYQGRLVNGTNLVNGEVNLSLRLFAGSSGGLPLFEDSNTVTVVDGLYSTLLGDQTNAGQFASALTNAQVWVEVVVNGTTLAPREKLASVAYALTAAGVQSGGVTASMLATGSVTAAALAVGAVSNTHIAAGALAGDRIVAGTFVRISGDTMTGALTNALAVTAARFRNSHNTATSDSASAVGGELNLAAGTASEVGGGWSNAASNDYATVAGGQQNTAGGYQASVGGGYQNVALGNGSAVGGGYHNTGSGHDSAIAGGFWNEASAYCATVGGGRTNTAGGYASTVSGGYGNTSTGMYSTVAGGLNNSAGALQAAVGGGTLNSVEAESAVIAGGYGNRIASNSVRSCIVGGDGNLIDALATGGFIGGGQNNTIMPYATNSVVAGGFYNVVGVPLGDAVGVMIGSAILGGFSNAVTAPYSAICGGYGNRAEAWMATVVGGAQNSASNDYAFIGGGLHNRAIGRCSVIAGGGGSHGYVRWGNQALAEYSTIGGGCSNVVNGEGATVPGGGFNLAAGFYSFAAGYKAKAQHDGSFVWGDNTDADLSTTGTNQFLVRASGGVGIGTTSPGAALQVESDVRLSERMRLSGREFFEGNYTATEGPTLLLGVNRPNNRQVWIADSLNRAVNSTNAVIRLILLGSTAQIDAYATDGTTPRNLQLGVSMMIKTNGNIGIGTTAPTNKLEVAGNVTAYAYYIASDRNLKENIAAVDANQLLEKVASLPIAQWNFTSEPGVFHIGPMAQDFRAAFQLGQNDTTLATVDESGVALAAIQALKKQNEDQQRQIDELKTLVQRLLPTATP